MAIILWLLICLWGVWVHYRFDLLSVYVICYYIWWLIVCAIHVFRFCRRADHSTHVCFIILVCYGIVSSLGSWWIAVFRFLNLISLCSFLLFMIHFSFFHFDFVSVWFRIPDLLLYLLLAICFRYLYICSLGFWSSAAFLFLRQVLKLGAGLAWDESDLFQSWP